MKFINAQERHKYHPDTFEVPAEEALKEVTSGDWVKIGVETLDHGERFWVRVAAVSPTGFIVGLIDNDLVYTHQHGYKVNDKITFEKHHVLAIIKDRSPWTDDERKRIASAGNIHNIHTSCNSAADPGTAPGVVLPTDSKPGMPDPG